MKGFGVLSVLLGIIGLLLLLSIGYGVYETVRGVDVHSSRITSEMKMLSTDAYIYIHDNGSYKGFCTSMQALGVPEQVFARGPLPQLSNLTNDNLTSYTCNDNASHWAASVPVGSDKFICIDDSIATVVNATMGGYWKSGVTLGLLVSAPVGASVSCSGLSQIQTIVSR